MPDIILKANINDCKVENWQTNVGEVNARELKVEMCEELSSCDNQFVTFELADGTVYESKVDDGKAEIPEFTESQYIKVGLFTENINGDECEKRYSPHPDQVLVKVGSYKGKADKPPMPTPGDYAKLLGEIKNKLDISNILTDHTEVGTDDKVYSAKSVNIMFENIGETLQTVFDELENKRNKLTEYTEVETDEGYYSAKATNEMFVALEQVFDLYNKEYNEKFATKDELENLKAELQGDIDEIGDLVGGEGSDDETETTIAEGTYTFEVDTDTGLSFYMVNDNVPYFQEIFKENDTFNVTFNGESFNNLTIKEVEGMQYIGSSSIFGLNDDVEAPFLISTLNDRGGLIIYTTLPADTYTLSISRIVGGAE